MHVPNGTSKQNANLKISMWSISTEEFFISSLYALKFDSYNSPGPSHKGLVCKFARSLVVCGSKWFY